jgi:hypothetical protein
MHNFKIREKFDVIFSIFDSINFLENFGQWKSTFEAVSHHLNRDGLFIFDIYTSKALQHFRGKEATASKFSNGYIYDKAVVKENALTWDFKIFEKVTEDMYQLHEYEWKEVIYPTPQVRSALSRLFNILESRHYEEGRRVFFVCQRKSAFTRKEAIARATNRA